MHLHPTSPGAAPPDLDGAVIVMPAVAFANIGELAVDALVATLRGALVGRLDDSNVLACVGNNAYVPQPPGLLATALELYQVPGTKLFLLQQRAPAITGRQRAFAEAAAAWAKQCGAAQLLLLCGLDAQFRRERQLEGTQLRWLAGGSSSGGGVGGAAGGSSGTGAAAAAAGGEPAAGSLAAALQQAGVPRLEEGALETEREVHGLLPPWPLLDAMREVRVACTLLATFAAEGDNVQDGLAVAASAIAALHAAGLLPPLAPCGAEAGGRAPPLQAPCSWVGLYGRSSVEAG